MAVVTGTLVDVFGITTPTGPHRESGGTNIYSAYITATFSGTYAQADNAQILAVDASIQSALRDGRTVTLLDAAFAAPGDEAGTAIGAKTVAVSGSDLTMELTGADMTTEHAGAALGTMAYGVCFFVTFKASGS